MIKLIFSSETKYFSSKCLSNIDWSFDNHHRFFAVKRPKKFWLNLEIDGRRVNLWEEIPNYSDGHVETSFGKFFGKITNLSQEVFVEWESFFFLEKMCSYNCPLWTHKMQFWQHCWSFTHKQLKKSAKVFFFRYIFFFKLFRSTSKIQVW